MCYFRAHSESAATRTASSGKNMKDLLHVAVGGCCCLLRTAAVLARAQVGRVPVPPVVLGMRLLVVVVVLRCLVEEFCKSRDVLGLCSRRAASRDFGRRPSRDRHQKRQAPRL